MSPTIVGGGEGPAAPAALKQGEQGEEGGQPKEPKPHHVPQHNSHWLLHWSEGKVTLEKSWVVICYSSRTQWYFREAFGLVLEQLEV